jgi:malate synthase
MPSKTPSSRRVAAPDPSGDAPASWTRVADGVEVYAAAWSGRARRLLPPDLLEAVAEVQRSLQPRRAELLAARRERQAAYDDGARPDYLPEDELPAARGDWAVAPLPEDLRRRRVEITGPVNNAKMVINMLSRNAEGDRADAAMLDFEDSMKPTWANVLAGLENVKGAAEGSLTFVRPASGDRPAKTYALDPDDMPLVMVRIRGLHLDESNVRVDGRPVSAAVFDLVCTAYHSARALLDRGRTPKYYIPKVEHYTEAAWMDALLRAVQERLGVDPGTFRVTFLIETLPAAYQMEEILYVARDHAAGLNGGRWDKIFSDIKVFREHADRVLADRNWIDIQRPWMQQYVKQLIRACHRRGALGMGGMAPQTPGRTAEERAAQVEAVVADKRFEAAIGHDGCWVSHPYFIGPALRPFAERLDAAGAPNQLDVIPDLPARPDLLPRPTGPKTLDGLRVNVRVSIGYMKGWNDDVGCVAWDNRMEDLATFEISRAQTWQWLHHRVALDGGARVTRERVRRVFAEELASIVAEVQAVHGEGADAEREIERYRRAAADAERIFTEARMRPFLACASERAGDAAHARRLLEGDSCASSAS